MERSGSQKFLRFISVINIILAALTIVVGVVSITGGALLGSVVDSAVERLAASTGLSQDELGVLLAGAGIEFVIAGVLDLFVGILGLRASNDNTKIMPVWVLAFLDLAFSVALVIVAAVEGTLMSSIPAHVVQVAWSVLMMWIANNIKVQAGK